MKTLSKNPFTRLCGAITRTWACPRAIVGAGLGLLCATAAALEAGTSSAASGPDPLYYHYFKERRALKLETERVAILQARTAAAEGLGPALSRFGLATEGTQMLPIAGWSLAGTSAASHTESATRDLVSRMSGDSAFEFVAPVFAGSDGGPNIVTPDLLVGFEPSVTEQRAEAILAELNAGDIIQRRFGNMKCAYHLRTRLKSGLDVLDLANKLAERPEVRFAEPDMLFTGRGELIPNDPGFTNLWGMQNTEQFGGALGIDMKAPQAWDITTGSSNIIVVILDVGVQPDHPDINQIPGTNFTSDASTDGGPVNACDNHGTAVAGCVSAIINNNLGTVGIAPGCRCASARAFIANNSCDNSWWTQSSWTVNALAWAQSIGARVSNNSNKYGLQFQSSGIAAEYLFTREMGMVHFAAAGNDATNSLVYPASLPGVNAVAELNEGGALAPESNHGTGLAFSAPGQYLYTTDRTGTNGYGSDDYVFFHGTSAASPYAAGVAALVLSVNSSLSATNVEQIMRQSCTDLGAPGYDTTYGWGLVNAYNAVMLALALPPTTITVTNTADSGAGTLRAALASAANGDTVDATGVTGTILLTSGELLVTNNVTILGPGPANLAVDGNGAHRAFNISGTAVTIAGLTITNGKASGIYPANAGGGIYTGPGTFTVSNCTFSGNLATNVGGGMFANHSILTVSTCTFSSNAAGGQGGGGIFINAVVGGSTLTVSNCAFSGNSASSDSGGAIYNNGQNSGTAAAQIVNSIFNGNSAASLGGGVVNDGHNSGNAALTVTACAFSNNPASYGGGIFSHGYNGSGTMSVSNCTFSGNSATNDSGGAIYNNGQGSGNATAQVVDSKLSGNSAGYGAGIYNDGHSSGSGTLTVSNCTLSSNSASGWGGGIFNNGASSGTGTVHILNSALSGNSAPSGWGGASINQGYSGNATLTVSASTLSGNSAQFGGGLFNNGDSGKGTLTLSNCTLTGNSASDTGGGIYNNGYSGSATLTVSGSTLSSNSAIGDGGGICNNGYAGSGTLLVSASTLSNNLATSYGGGIYNRGINGSAMATVIASTLRANSAQYGGSIFNDGTSSGKATLLVSTTTLSGNSASGDGGGIYNDGYTGSATSTVNASTLSGNSANGAGAGIYNNGKSSGTGTVQIATSTLSGNLATGDGGGIYNDGTSSGKATLTVKASTLSGNSAHGGNGGAIRNNGGGGSASVELGSSILKAGASGGNIANLGGTVSSDGFNLSSDGGGGFLTGAADQINTEPMLGPLEDNGGPTFTHALFPGSPAIDKGKNLIGSATDQRGFPRTVDSPCIANAPGGDGTDIGAFEVQQPCPLAVSLGNVGAALNQFGFDISGGSNQVVVVEASTNLVSWTALATNTLGAAALHFNDPYWTNLQQRFYRAKLAP